MYKIALLVFAVLAVASAQYLASPYAYSGYNTGVYRTAAAYPAYSAYSTPYAYSGLGYAGYGYGNTAYLYR